MVNSLFCLLSFSFLSFCLVVFLSCPLFLYFCHFVFLSFCRFVFVVFFSFCLFVFFVQTSCWSNVWRVSSFKSRYLCRNSKVAVIHWPTHGPMSGIKLPGQLKIPKKYLVLTVDFQIFLAKKILCKFLCQRKRATLKVYWWSGKIYLCLALNLFVCLSTHELASGTKVHMSKYVWMKTVQLRWLC